MLKEVRARFLNFFEKNEHKVIGSMKLVPKNDPSLLFINSGMAPLKKYFLNEEIAPYKRMTNSQKCLRVGGKHNDLQDVGYTKRHHTFFEMLGNFAFNDYKKEEAIGFAWKFLTQDLKIDFARLYVTIHPDDEESFKIWEKIISKDRITKLKDNIWAIGNVGPFGYCTEIFYDLENTDNIFDEFQTDRFLEVWNIVFTQFFNDGKNKTELPYMSIDAGMGLERLVSVLENVKDTYDISFFKNVLKFLNLKEQTADSKIFLDHLRSVSFLINENVLPGPNARGYVVRRLIRRMLKSFFELNLDFKTVVFEILNEWQKDYDDVIFDIQKIYDVLDLEKEQFHKMLEQGLERFEEYFKKSTHFSKEDLFKLHDTYGLSVDITIDLLKKRGGTADFEGFESLIEANKEKAKAKNVFQALPFPKTNFVDKYEIQCNLIGVYENYLILDQTPFYAESGGQVGDVGIIYNEFFEANIKNTIKHMGVFLHEFNVSRGTIQEGPVFAKIDKQTRNLTTKNHSATHILFKVVEKLYGKIEQAGSKVSFEKLRIDIFSKNEIKYDADLIEKNVNQYIFDAIDTKIELMKYEDAIKLGANAFFDYENEVRVVTIGDAIDLCGGTHVKNTSEINLFKITKISSLKANTKRIEAITSEVALGYLNFMNNFLSQKANSVEVKTTTPAKKYEILQEKIANFNIGFVTTNENLRPENLINKYQLDLVCIYQIKEKKSSLIIKSEQPYLSALKLVNSLKHLINAKGAGGNESFAQTGGEIISNPENIFNLIKKEVGAENESVRS